LVINDLVAIDKYMKSVIMVYMMKNKFNPDVMVFVGSVVIFFFVAIFGV